ncbi:hypothetical protein Tsubulata_046888, partial [Turnera subulata]
MAYVHVLFIFLTQVLLLLALVDETSAKVPAIIVFGDSTVDAGNNNVIATVLKSNFKPYGRDFEGGRPTGRFSNGRIPPDFISEAFGLKPNIPAYLDPAYSISDFATGVCFASAGTGYDNATSSVLNVIPLWKELEYYKDYQNKLRAYIGEGKANEILSEALYLMSLGTNDFLENYYIFPTRQAQFTVQQYQDFLVGLARNFITELYNLGVRKMSLTGVPPMGCLPLERTTNVMEHHDCTQKYNNVAIEFNSKLQNLVSQLNRELPGFRIYFTRTVYDTLYGIIRKPSSYGYEVTGVACCATGTFEMSYLCNSHSFTCPDANKYILSIYIHHKLFQMQGTSKTFMANMYPQLLLLVQFLLAAAPTIQAKVPGIIIFGDSSVDAGNNNFIPTVARSNFEPYGRDFNGGKPTGRFSNGRIATDFISQALGLKPSIPAYLDPAYNISDFAVGVTFASAGTGYDNATSDVLSVIPFWKQLEYYKEYQKKLRAYLGESKANQVINESLHMISMGTNDFLENYYTIPGGRSTQYSIEAYEDFLVGIADNFVQELYGLGARKISLGGLPPMGCMPLERTTNMMSGGECVDRYNIVALEFNDKLNDLTMKLNRDLPGIMWSSGCYTNLYNL